MKKKMFVTIFVIILGVDLISCGKNIIFKDSYELPNFNFLHNIFESNATPLILAIRNDNYIEVEKLLDAGVDINKRDGINKMLPIECAMCSTGKNRYKIVDLLLNNGSHYDVDALYVEILNDSPNDDENVRLERFELFKKILKMKNIKNVNFSKVGNEENDKKNNYYVLMVAGSGCVNELEYILDNYDFDINYKDKSGNTALIMATKKRKYKTFEMLVKKGADINIKNNNLKTAYDYIVENNTIDEMNNTNEIRNKMLSLLSDYKK